MPQSKAQDPPEQFILEEMLSLSFSAAEKSVAVQKQTHSTVVG